jgi:signal transduction histidine kinase
MKDKGKTKEQLIHELVELRRRMAALEALETEQRRMEEALRRSLEEVARGQRLLLALSQAAQAVQRARTPDEVYRAVGDEIARLGYHALVFTVTDDRAHLVLSHVTFKLALVQAVEKLTGLSARDYRFPLVPGGSYQQLIAEGKTAFTEQVAERVAEILPAPVRPLAGQVAARLGLQQSIATLLRAGGETHGLLVVAGTGLTKADVPAMTAFANQAAIAIENARLYEQAQQVAVMEERSRLARELHDSVTQSLFSMTLTAQAARILLERDPRRVEPQLARLQELARGALTEMRSLIFELRPVAVEEEGLVSALRKHIAAVRSREGLAIDFRVSGERRLVKEQEVALFRIVQEALNNVVKHARAERAVVDLSMGEEAICLLVADDGMGFDPRTSVREGKTMGLVNMRERVEMLDGSLEIDSQPGEGTRIRVKIPLN